MNKRGRFGRTEHITDERGFRRLAWAIYEGEERDGYLGKVPIAWFMSATDAREFVAGRALPLDPKEAQDAEG